MPDTPIPFATRLWFAWACFFSVLFTGRIPRRPIALPDMRTRTTAPAIPPPPPADAALQLLALFQREGRLVDFLEQDVATFPDAEVGAAARVVHEGCRKALRAHAKVLPVRAEEEGARVTIAAASPAEVKLTGNVGGAPPYKGVLRHRGWRVEGLTLPTPVDGYDASVLAPAEVEL